MPTDVTGDYDPQDQAEVFDEDNTSTLDGAGDASAEMLTLEEMPDVYDVTSATGDTDDDAAAIGEELDDDEIIDLEADASEADIEDDELNARMPEAFDDDEVGDGEIEEVRFAEEATFDIRDDDEYLADDSHSERAMSRANDDVDLEFTDDLDAISIEDAQGVQAMESDTVSDEDLQRLGYADDRP